jgi:kynurenine 3-monooxygenase
LALSERGINGLRKANVPGLIEAVLEETIPMHGRMIHGAKQGEVYEESQNYDIHGRVPSVESIYAVGESLTTLTGNPRS